MNKKIFLMIGILGSVLRSNGAANDVNPVQLQGQQRNAVTGELLAVYELHKALTEPEDSDLTLEEAQENVIEAILRALLVRTPDHVEGMAPDGNVWALYDYIASLNHPSLHSSVVILGVVACQRR